MRCRFLILFFLIFRFSPDFINAQGLQFNGNRSHIDERTSFYVFGEKPHSFVSELSIEFELLITRPAQMGYIIRIKSEDDKTVYNVSFHGEDDHSLFKLNEEGKSSLITARVESDKIEEYQWRKVKLFFDMCKDSVYLNIGANEFSYSGIDLPDKWTAYIIFGRSEHLIDVPEFAIRNLAVGDRNDRYFFPLNEDKGNIVYSERGKKTGYVENPAWLINDSYFWSYRTQFSSAKLAYTNYNPTTQEVYFIDADKISVYNLRTDDTSAKERANENLLRGRTGMSFIDTLDNKLYLYEVYTGRGNDGYIACLDLDDYTWKTTHTEAVSRQLHHHGGWFDAARGRYEVFGGFGHRRYLDYFYSYTLGDGHWERITYQGDHISPRYFLSLGYNPADSAVYIFGGMGNESGDQIVGRRYYYDLYKVDTQRNSITKLWEKEWEGDNMVPVRGMVISGDSCFYTLCYPEHISNSHLQLYRFSLIDGGHEILGDSIPIRSDKITTNANLYFNYRYNELCALIQEFDEDDKGSAVRVYTLSFPPVTRGQLGVPARYAARHDMLLAVICISILIAACIVVLALFVIKRHNKSKYVSTGPEYESRGVSAEIVDKANAIYLFGEFTVRNRNNRDISYMFSTKVKQVFILILGSSLDNGISSQELSRLMWPDRTEDKVKNSRGVTINHLRKILAELDGISLVHEQGAYKIRFAPGCYCDYIRCLEIIGMKGLADQRSEFITVLTRGKFLKSLDMPVFDQFKRLVENNIEFSLIGEMHDSFSEADYRTTIYLAQAMFDIDPVNDTAIRYELKSLSKLKQHEEARKRYVLFVTEYRRTMGEEYKVSFEQLLQ